MIAYNECSEIEKKNLNGYMKTYEDLLRHIQYKIDETGKATFSRNIMRPLPLEDEMWIRSMATIYRKLTSTDSYSFDKNLSLLSQLLRRDESSMSAEQIEKRNSLLKDLKVHKKDTWNDNFARHGKPQGGLYSNDEIVSIIHNEYIFHTDTRNSNGPLYENEYPSFGDAHLELPYFGIILARNNVLNHLHYLINRYKHNVFFDTKEENGISF